MTVNNFHRKLEFTMEKPDKNGDFAFLDISIIVNSSKKK